MILNNSTLCSLEEEQVINNSIDDSSLEHYLKKKDQCSNKHTQIREISKTKRSVEMICYILKNYTIQSSW